MLMFQIIAQRVATHFGRNTHNYYVWNNAPGALMSIREYSTNLADYPFYISASDIKTKQASQLTNIICIISKKKKTKSMCINVPCDVCTIAQLFTFR